MAKDVTMSSIKETLKLKLHEPRDLIMNKLDEQYLTVAEVLRILDVTRRQLFHWDKKGLRLGKSKSPDRSWRKFSLMNLYGFTLIKELLKLDLKLDYCKFLLDWLRERIYGNPYFLVHYATGDHLLLFLDIEEGKVNSIFGENDLYLLNMDRPNMVVPLHTILTTVLDYNRRKDFHVEFRRIAEFKNPTNAVFHVDGKPIKFERSLLDYEHISQ